nr:PREDICTED: protein FAM110B-like [Lepisosteus oculatus]
MPVETLQAGGMVRQVSSGIPFTSAMPFRILHKGPEYFRRQLEPSSKKPSAVERLEADKAKYVKSQQVASTRQEPVKPPLIKKPLMSPGALRAMSTPTRRPPLALRRAEACNRRGALNLEILNNLINVCDGPLSASRPPAESGGGPPPRALPGPPSPACTHLSSASSRGSRKQPALHRSKSDLSDRYSRATADLERFFNYCGLDPEEIESIGVERFARASSDIVSVSKLHSVSTPSSECGRSQRSRPADEAPGERVPYGVSVIERNARVIKWLYGLRQAREAQRVSNV